MTFGSLFAGIGGMDLGLERAGMQVRWQCEIDDFCTRVLTKHWPSVARFRDVRLVGAGLERVDLIAGGFPCQDLSRANSAGAGLDGERSGLWIEMRRIVDGLRPTWVVVENVHHAWRSWVPDVRRDLRELGYASVPLQLSAAELGADHCRKRAFVVANTNSEFIRKLSRGWIWPRRQVATEPLDHRWGTAASRVARVDDGIPNGVDRRRGLGNACSPQVIEMIGRAIMSAV